MKSIKIAILSFAALALAVPAGATTIAVYTAIAAEQHGKATFDVTGNTFTVTLENTAAFGQLQKIESVLDGISFSVVGGGVLSGASLTGSAPGGGLNCTGAGNNVPGLGQCVA